MLFFDSILNYNKTIMYQFYYEDRKLWPILFLYNKIMEILALIMICYLILISSESRMHSIVHEHVRLNSTSSMDQSDHFQLGTSFR